MYRISTSMMHDNAGRSIQTQSAELFKLQNQISSGKKISQPSDDPVGAVKLLDLQKQQAEYGQYAKNIAAATNRSNLEETATADITSVLQRVRDLVVQGGNVGTLSQSNREAIADEIQSGVDQLQAIANRKDSNGEYLFAGFSSQTQPFARNGANVMQYLGDSGSRLAQVGASQWIPDGDSGSAVFNNVTQGNGTFYTAANAANTGSGSIDVGSVTNKAAWVPDNYTLTFTSASNWQVTDSATPTPNVVANGTYTAGSAITFNGIQVSVSGAPTTGDTFAINQSHTEDMFTTLDSLVAAFKQSGVTSTGNARLTTAVAGGLQQLDQALDHATSIRAQIGTRINALQSADSARQDSADVLTKSISDLQDLDYATALTKYSSQQVALQAAQQSYAQIAKLSLFNYL